MDKILEIRDVTPLIKEIEFEQPINWKIKKGENWAVIGPNGAGKTLLIDILTGKYAIKSGEMNCWDESGNQASVMNTVKVVAFRDIYSLTDIKNSYYQQRWNAGDEHQAAKVKDLLKNSDTQWLDYLISAFNIGDLVDKEINLLSSGELRKFLIVRSLINKPRILILDNPFIGLDFKSRAVLNELLHQLALSDKIQIVLILSNPSDIPDFITHILPIKDKTLGDVVAYNDFIGNKELHKALFCSKDNEYSLDAINDQKSALSSDDILTFKNIHIKYYKRIILNNINWQIKKGEKWALLGENGAGKSTLLSLVAADNPQAYANDITLFGKKRGSGESIWDIKKHIGYISPEVHLYYLKNNKCIDIVGSGFFDTIGLYKKCSEEQSEKALAWMKVFGVAHLQEVSFLKVSSGEQRLILLARLFVKNPSLLILDEPLHGLDIANKQKVKAIIEKYCDNEKSLIYVTHYEDEIPSIVDKRLVLKKYIN